MITFSFTVARPSVTVKADGVLSSGNFPNISKAMEEGKDLLKQITRSRGFGMGM